MPTIEQLMHAANSQPAPDAQVDDARGREAGFTLVEILVVVLIIAIIIGMIITTFGGSKTATYYRVGIATAGAYNDAVESYMADNGQVAPAIGGPDWPDAKRGPIDHMLNGKPYMRTVPDAAQSGLATLVTNGSSPRGSQVAIDYITYPGAPSDFTFRVRTLHTSKPITCVITNRGTLARGEKPCE